MTTRQDVYDAVEQIGQAGYADFDALDAAADALTCPPEQLDPILDRLHKRFPQVFKPEPAAAQPGGQEQRGSAAQAMRSAEAELSLQHSAAAQFDRQVIEALLHAHKTTVAGRQALDGLDAEIESAVRSADLSTAAGARQLQAFLLAKLGQIIAIVETANADDTSKQALAAAWAALYAEQAVGDGHVPTGDDPGSGVDRYPEPLDGYFDDLPTNEPAGPSEAAGHRPLPSPTVVAGPLMPAGPGLSSEPPASVGLPTGGIPAGLVPGGWTPGPHRQALGGRGDDGWPPTDELSDGPTEAENEDARRDADTPAADPRLVTLPDGETVTAATPQLAAVVQSAADGTPIAEAFRRQGITIPPPGTAVTGPLDQSRVGLGDIGMFTDRHALGLGNGRALLDGQIQRVANVRGPSFLGWQHPPVTTEPASPELPPTPTRPAAAVPA